MVLSDLTKAGKLSVVIQVLGLVIPALTSLESIVTPTQALYVAFSITVLNGLVVLLQSISNPASLVKIAG